MTISGLRRVMITGIGTVSPLGNTMPATWENILKCSSGAGRITRFDPSLFSSRIACEVKDFKIGDFVSKRLANKLDRPSQYSLRAAKEACDDAGLELDREDPYMLSSIVGIGLGSIEDIEHQHSRFMEKGPGRISPFLVPKMMPNASAANIAIFFGLKGPSFSTNSACAASANALLDAYRTIAYGEADVCFTGGVEAAITVLGIGGFCMMKALSTRNDEPEKASRPFDKDRDGFVMGEGAAILVFEEYEHAKARGAKIYAEMTGGGNTCDAFHISAPEPSGESGTRAMLLALERSEINPDEVDYINAHGTSTLYNDKTETKVIKNVLGEENARKTPVSSTKSMTGHLLGGAAALEAALTVKAMCESIILPTINLENPDPECDLDYVPNQPREQEIKVALSNSLGFGGHNVTLAFRKV